MPESDRDPLRGRRWPLRAALSASLVALLGVGFVTSDARHRALASPTTNVAASTSMPVGATTAPSPTPTTTTTTTSTPARPATPGLVSNAAALDQWNAHCGLHMLVPPTTTSTTTTSAASTTTMSDTTSSDAVSTTTTSIPAAASHKVRGLGRCTVLEVGDSLGNDLGWGLARELVTTPQLRLVQADRSSTGLANSWFYDWPTNLAALLAEHHPDLVVICLGANDQQNMKVSGSSQAFATAAWTTAYRAEVRRLVRLATNAGAFVLWVGLPIMGPYGYNQGARFLNAQYASVVAGVAGATFLPTWRLTANGRGQFQYNARVNHVGVTIRSADGIHFSVVGENVLATFVAGQIAQLYHVPLRLAAPQFITP
jgi:hypothetical protein